MITPRLTDYHGIHLEQASLDFAIPLFNEDLPLYFDPFLLWCSPSHQDQSLHTSLINAFNHLGVQVKKGDVDGAVNTLIIASECDEVGLGSSAKRKGKKIGQKKARGKVMAISEKQVTTQQNVDAYKSLIEVFSHLYTELKALGIKKPAETLSKSKVAIIK